MAADLREMQENQGFSENRIDKLEFAEVQMEQVKLRELQMKSRSEALAF